MTSPDVQTAIITCPDCGTRYQVPRTALGSSGREVSCAQCGKAWHAQADDVAPPPPAPPVPVGDTIFTDIDEDALDAAFEAEAASLPAPASLPPASASIDPDHQRTLDDIRAAIAPKPKSGAVNALDPALLKQASHSFAKRQRSLRERLPMARVRRTARLGALVLLLSILVLGYALRTDLVRWFPALAGAYAAMGLPVNIVGLEFEDAKTLMSLRAGKPVMQITARIRSVASRTVAVPPVLVSLFDARGGVVYEWTVTPKAAEMEPGEILDFATEVNAPPEGATTVRLTFTDLRGLSAPSSKAL